MAGQLYAEMQTGLSAARLAQLTNPDAPANAQSSPNLTFLQQAVNYAIAHFGRRTGVPYDDTTPTATNTCSPIGFMLTVAYLYTMRGLVTEVEATGAAWKAANDGLREWLNNYGAGAWAAPASDSQLRPSTQPSGSLPTFDNQRLAGIVPLSPGPSNDLGGGASLDGWGY